MESRVIESIPFQLEMEKLSAKLHITPEKPYYKRLEELVQTAQTIGRPKAIFKASTIEERGKDYLVIDGIKFSSRILAVNLADTDSVFPYVITCGTELAEWAETLTDMLDSFITDAIMEAVLRSARDNFFLMMDQDYMLTHASTMNPGSLPEWPIREQVPLFQLLGDVTGKTGVVLKPSFLMMPIKSVSGIRFPNEATYENCMLCPKENCPGRKSPYDQQLYIQKYGDSEM